MSENCVSVWNQCLSIIKESINPQSYATWFEPITPLKLLEDTLTVQVPSQFFYEWLEGHYSGLINKALLQVVGENARLSYSVLEDSNGKTADVPTIDRKKYVKKYQRNGNLIDRYNFDTFVEGANNQFARAAAVAVAEAPGKTTFNPLVIYGGVGLGKTHLIQAIGHYTINSGTATNVLYVDSEKFTIEFINSIQNNKTTEFSSI
ncbi:MAG: chromosomal replication initiator protein DnaA, partial [Phototrophicales bacterium]